MSQSDIVAPLEAAYSMRKEQVPLVLKKRMATITVPSTGRTRPHTHHRPLSTRTEVTVEVAALKLDIDAVAVRRLIARGALPAWKKRGIWLINREGLRTYYEAQQVVSEEARR